MNIYQPLQHVDAFLGIAEEHGVECRKHNCRVHRRFFIICAFKHHRLQRNVMSNEHKKMDVKRTGWPRRTTSPYDIVRNIDCARGTYTDLDLSLHSNHAEECVDVVHDVVVTGVSCQVVAVRQCLEARVGELTVGDDQFTRNG